MVITATMAPDQGVYREYCTALMANLVYAAEFASKFQFPHLTEVSCTGRGRPPVHFRHDYFLESVLPDGKYPFHMLLLRISFCPTLLLSCCFFAGR